MIHHRHSTTAIPYCLYISATSQTPIARGVTTTDVIASSNQSSTSTPPEFPTSCLPITLEAKSSMTINRTSQILKIFLCPENVFLHFIVSNTNLEPLIESIFPLLTFKTYYFDPEIEVKKKGREAMKLLELPECPVCLQTYDGKSTTLRVLASGHSICETCLTQLPKPFPFTIRCLECSQLGPYAPPKNIDLLRLCSLLSPLKP